MTIILMSCMKEKYPINVTFDNIKTLTFVFKLIFVHLIHTLASILIFQKLFNVIFLSFCAEIVRYGIQR